MGKRIEFIKFWFMFNSERYINNQEVSLFFVVVFYLFMFFIAAPYLMMTEDTIADIEAQKRKEQFWKEWKQYKEDLT